MRAILSIVADVLTVFSIGALVLTVALIVLWFFLTANGANPFR